MSLEEAEEEGQRGMHILMLSDYEGQWGAAIAASRLAEALGRAGQRVTRIVWFGDKQEHRWTTHVLPRPGGRPMAYRVAGRLGFSGARAAWDRRHVRGQLRRILADVRPDAISVHNLHGASWPGWCPDLVRTCLDCVPTAWTLHDMWSFTGRCAYSFDCRKFITGCDASCPTPTEHPRLEPRLIAPAWEERRRLFADRPDLVGVTPSRWLRGEALAGAWSGHRVEVIPNGLPLGTYHPVRRELAREALGIESRGPLLLVTAMELSDRRKGAQLLLQALPLVRHRPLTVVTLGRGALRMEDGGIGLHALGYVEHERTRVLAYNAADALVHPARADNLPNVVVESIACGTPVIGFAVGGVAEVARPGETGWLAEEVSPASLARVLEQALDDLQSGLDLRSSCRAVAEKEYADDLQATRYMRLFRSLGCCTDPDEGPRPPEPAWPC